MLTDSPSMSFCHSSDSTSCIWLLQTCLVDNRRAVRENAFAGKSRPAADMEKLAPLIKKVYHCFGCVSPKPVFYLNVIKTMCVCYCCRVDKTAATVPYHNSKVR